MTRTVATGPAAPAGGDLPRLPRRPGGAVAAARGGVSAAELDAVARTRIAEAGYGEHFGHGLGHGVGLRIHERPGVRPRPPRRSSAGMAVTIEPGIYLEGEGGVRIEDLVVLTERAAEVLSTVAEGPEDRRVRGQG